MSYKFKSGEIFNNTFSNDTQFSDIIDIRYCEHIAVKVLIIGGTILNPLSGTITLQAKLGDSDWVDTTTVQSIGGQGDDFIWNLENLAYSHFRIKIISNNNIDAEVLINYGIKGL